MVMIIKTTNTQHNTATHERGRLWGAHVLLQSVHILKVRDETMHTTTVFLTLLATSLLCATLGATTDSQLVQVQFYGEAL